MNNVWTRILCGTTAVGLYAWQMLAPAPAPAVARELSSVELAALSKKVKTLLGEDRYQDALEPAKALHAALPDDPINIERLATVYHHLGRPAEEAGLWQRYLDVAPLPVEACAHLDHAYLALHDVKRQMDAAERCLALEPENPDLIFARGHVWEIAGQPAKAESYYRRGLLLAPGDADLAIGLARVQLNTGRTREALTTAGRIVKTSSRNPDAWLVLGMALMQSEQPSRARTALEKGLELSETYPDIHILLGHLAEREHDTTMARTQYRRVLHLDPGNREARNALGRLDR